MSEIRILCSHSGLMAVSELKKRVNQRNPNRHSPEQIARLVQLFRYYGVRHPIILDAETGEMVAGHGRLEAAEHAGMREFPVDEQAFADDAERYGFMVSDNAIQQQWAELDMAAINLALPDLGPDFDLDMLGLKDFTLDPPNFEPGTEDDQGKLDEKKPVECPACGHSFAP